MTLTREQLHEKVWSQPMKTLAKTMGISDVALAKRCKAANVPVPPRGWWARKEAGKSVKIEPLPALPFALANYFPALARSASSTETALSTTEQRADGEPVAPVFRELSAVMEEIRAAIRPIKPAANLDHPHIIVARLLKQDAKRVPRPSLGSYLSDYYGPKFDKPVQQRRLRILSSIFIELERLGCKASGSTHAGERFSINVGGCGTSIFLGVEGGSSASYFYQDGRARKDREKEALRLDVGTSDDRTPPKRTWREDRQPLERQLSEIVASLLIQVEEDARKSALWRYKWACEDRERKVREAKLAAEKAEADRIAREKAAAAARIDALVGGADALERSERIRRYVIAVQNRCASSGAVAAGDVTPVFHPAEARVLS